ncbi:MAG: amylo-alpha-1,6-glucosidase [Candidatus Levyibacteriota bacterium]
MINKKQLINQAREIFKTNVVEGYSDWKKTSYRYIAPAKKGYPYQWLWDTGFQAIVLSHFDTNWAKNEIRNLLLVQDLDGFLPHVIFWDETMHTPLWASMLSRDNLHVHTTNITQPPVLAIAIEEIYKRDKDKKFLKEVLPKIGKYHRYLLEMRDPDKTHLLSIISADESGMDELPIFQYAAGLKTNNVFLFHFYNRKADILNKFNRYDIKKILEKDYFTLKEPFFNVIFIEACKSLSRLYLQIDNKTEAEYFKKQANKAMDALIALCWDTEENIFYPTYSKNNLKIPIKTIVSLAPLFLSDLDKQYVDLLVQKHLLNTEEFWLPYPLASVAKSEVFFDPSKLPFYWVKALWRGPVWLNANWLIIKGLQKHGYDTIADQIIKKSAKLVAAEGFREYYNPFTGSGYGKENFGWSTLLLDLL